MGIINTGSTPALMKGSNTLPKKRVSIKANSSPTVTCSNCGKAVPQGSLGAHMQAHVGSNSGTNEVY